MRAAQSTEDLRNKAGQAGEELKTKAGETGEVFKSNVAQLLGVRGGEQTADKWKIRLQLTKPVTWVPLIWGAQGRASLIFNSPFWQPGSNKLTGTLQWYQVCCVEQQRQATSHGRRSMLHNHLFA